MERHRIDRYHGGIIKDLCNVYNILYLMLNYPLKNHYFVSFSSLCLVKDCVINTKCMCGICYHHHPIQKVEDYPCSLQNEVN